MVIKPTIGRKLWFWQNREDFNNAAAVAFNHDEGPQPEDATVVRVWGDRCVNLHVINHNGSGYTMTSVVLVQEGDAVPGLGSFATWMPFQAAQAKKS